jgi:uncharacterized membrane protein YhhN
MKGISILLIILYAADLIFDSVLGKLGTAPTRYITKGLLMPLLISFFIVEVKDEVRNTKLTAVRLICLALIFSFIGDLFLVNGTVKYNFAFGLAFFLIVQACYILFFYRIKPFAKKDATFLFIATLIILAYLVTMNYIFWPKVYYQNFIWPVIVYSFALGLMLLCAVNVSNSRRFHRTAVIFFIPGAISFIASDSMIAANRFYFPPTRPLPDYYTIGTYCLAQFLFVMGAIQFIAKRKHE